MITQITKDGLLIPRPLFESIGDEGTEVEVRREGEGLVILPVVRSPRQEPDADPIRGLGVSPVELPVVDASENYDRYLYAGE